MTWYDDPWAGGVKVCGALTGAHLQAVQEAAGRGNASRVDALEAELALAREAAAARRAEYADAAASCKISDACSDAARTATLLSMRQAIRRSVLPSAR